jgi:hypothetical protein
LLLGRSRRRWNFGLLHRRLDRSRTRQLEIAKLRIADRVGFLRLDAAHGDPERERPECGSTDGSKAVQHGMRWSL